MVTLDRTDRKILRELQKDGRISNLELAEKVGISPSPCSRRVKALYDAGVIAQTVTLLNAKALGLNLMAMIYIGMDRHTPERLNNFERCVEEFEEVLECFLITGTNADYLLKVIVTDMEAFQEFLLGKLTRIDGVTGVQSSFVMRKVLDGRHLSV